MHSRCETSECDVVLVSSETKHHEAETERSTSVEMHPVGSIKSIVPEESALHSSKTPMHETAFDTIPLAECDNSSIGGTSGIAGASFNFVNSIVGAGIIGMPYALYRCGFGLGLFLLVFVGYLVDYGVRLLIELGLKTGKRSYEDLCQFCFGSRGFYVVSGFMFIFAYGAMVAYIIVIGDTIPILAARSGADILQNREIVIVIFSTLFILPLSLLKDMSSLSWSSLISILADAVLVAIVVLAGPSEAEKQGISFETEEAPFSFGRSTFFAGLGTISFAYTCHHSSFFVHGSMKNPTSRQWSIVTHISVAIAFLACGTMALGGYLSFFSSVKGDVLNNFDENDVLINFARALLAMTMIFTYPMEHFVARHSLHALIYPKCRTISNFKHYALTLILWSSTVILGLLFEDVGVILELTGAVAASVLGYILPGALYFSVNHHIFEKVKAKWKKGSQEYEMDLIHRLRLSSPFIIPGLMIGFGFLAAIVGFISAFYE